MRRKAVDGKYPCLLVNYDCDVTDEVKDFIRSRDTYWKEMVRKEVEGMKKHESHIGIGGLYTAQVQMEVNQALDTLLDNLK